MTDDAARSFGVYLRDLRAQRKQSVRGLAAAAGIDSGTVTRLEHGDIHAPSPDTLKQLAGALDVPLADLFAMAGYVTPQELPSITPYIHARYQHLPEDTRLEIAAYCRRRLANDEVPSESQAQEGPAQS
jgi:transcriptional regulator with XRE-family HTH domain